MGRQDDDDVVRIPAPKPSPAAASDAAASASHSAFVHSPLFGASPSWTGVAPGFAPGSGTGPKSYSYMVQVQPHPRSKSYRQHQSTRVTLDSKKHAVDHHSHNAAHGAHSLFDERPPFTGHTFQSFPFGPFNAPASFTHGNPLKGFKPSAGADLGGLFAERPIASITVHGAQRTPPRLQRPKAAKAAAKKRPVEIGTLGDPHRPNLGIVGVPGQDYDEPPPPRVREYDPYTGRFKVVATEDGHDSREAYRRPGASSEEDSQMADVPLESYEVYERPVETPSAVAPAPMRGSACRQKQRDILAGLLAPLLDSMRPASKCQASQAAKSERFATLHRPRAPPRRKQVKQRMKQHKQREPYFEFRNPVHSYISGTPEHRGRGLQDDDDEPPVLGHAVHHDAVEHDDDAEYLAMGDAERAALDDAEEQRLLGGHGDENVFAPYSVYRTVTEPDKKFKPSVRYPFEEERANLKDLVEQLG
ncbi:uncharacterized protein LOC117643923 [Thrips palmi]|uniref:Uncharacterized protein LOC117643923 n=1 Tax=Thrips palmi TaxID=161013 RepID=A0A6P8YP41_THRPL|nr:uncharacterized protein LOC117643923 [Thrips palmi]